ncbi:aminotransferase class I/II-fold pyridoxal phosphate-dependent enzyme [Erwiniaceae bacterium BAC15a-03b]|uniref:Aminotransferase class I/II-fold pyridoxal phosphate-dependent enzyme n=1 Tax=Winslowiella arboricola TaxID=2978220 RepID=A0A9J6PF73_9GAMM|nr:aminotransferase class I/II-fold pyridoxal phosphate-dependent enzyme [Winslowiella arboricola]MCU5774114.1 aminotransferase class I/II-fold pyridoxal phosphate-dependent enzyme [Winslowiella arboricola]MCU5776953.1 aminotransferase class I/II-fold pyridoxal phosphate-dependent enzyme [Winslowiella arboricola]
MTPTLDLNWLAERITEPSLKGIALTVATLIREGAIPIGAHLPAVRDLAEKLGVSPATVSAAWGQLKRQKVLAGKGRSGVWVCGDTLTPRPVRFEKIGNYGNQIKADLILSAPDAQLLPDLRAAMLHGIEVANLNSYQREPIVPALVAALKPGWPLPAEAFLATDGGFDAMNLILQTLVSPGEKVVIEDPTATRLLDMLDNVGAEVLPLPCDEQGPLPDALARLMQKSPAMFIYQPRTHSTTGNTVTEARSQALAQVLVGSTTLIVEDDGIGELSAWPVWSLGKYFPERTLHVRSFSKAYGPDLRLAVISASQNLVQRIQSYRNFGASWTSRILQGAVAWMLHDKQTQESIVRARTVYARRRQKLIDALAQRGMPLPTRDGLCIYIPVESEQFAMITLAAHGIAVYPGERFRCGSDQFIRLSTSIMPEDQIEAIADALILACGSGPALLSANV